MEWVIFALLGPFLWAICNIIYKVVRTKHVKDSYSYMMFIGPFALLPWLIVPFTGFNVSNYFFVFLALLSGAIQTISGMLYLHSISLEDISRIIALYRFSALFTLLLAAIFLGEKLIPKHYLAFALMVIGGFLISVRKTEGMFRLSKAFFLILGACIFSAISLVIVKYVSSSMHYPEYFILNATGFFIGSQLWWFTNKRKKAIETFRGMNKKSKILIVIPEIIGWFALASVFYAVKLASVSLVNAIGSFQPLFVFFFATMLSFKFPQVLKEELNLKVLAVKFASITIMFIGLMLIYIK